jgi:hypothetical protein
MLSALSIKPLVRRKPLAFAADAVYGNSIDLELKAIVKKGVARKAWLLMLVIRYC